VPETSPGLERATERAIAIAGSLKDARASALPRAMMGAGAAFTGRLREGARDMQAALNDMDQNTDPHSNAMIADFLAMTYARLGEFDAADEMLAGGTQQAAVPHADQGSPGFKLRAARRSAHRCGRLERGTGRGAWHERPLRRGAGALGPWPYLRTPVAAGLDGGARGL